MQSIKILNVRIYFFLKFAKDAFCDINTMEVGRVIGVKCAPKVQGGK